MKLTRSNLHNLSGGSSLPSHRQDWDLQYAAGNWEYLKQLQEVAHYAVLAGYLLYTRCHDRVLDVGCGEGVLLEYLKPYSYSRYVGIDLSEIALQKNRHKLDSKTFFVAADANEFRPRGQFDAIVFNESLHHFRNPMDVYDAYRSLLDPSGVLVVSLFLFNSRASQLVRQLNQTYHCLEQVSIKSSRGTWICSLFDNHASGPNSGGEPE